MFTQFFLLLIIQDLPYFQGFLLVLFNDVFCAYVFFLLDNTSFDKYIWGVLLFSATIARLSESLYFATVRILVWAVSILYGSFKIIVVYIIPSLNLWKWIETQRVVLNEKPINLRLILNCFGDNCIGQLCKVEEQ